MRRQVAVMWTNMVHTTHQQAQMALSIHKLANIHQCIDCVTYNMDMEATGALRICPPPLICLVKPTGVSDQFGMPGLNPLLDFGKFIPVVQGERHINMGSGASARKGPVHDMKG
jgi:hypothetical protein